MMSDNIRGKVVAITGASSGLAAATGFPPPGRDCRAERTARIVANTR
jgi:hypothetical protein